MKQPAGESSETRASPAPAEAIAKRKQVSSRALFGNARELLIEHAGEIYSLRQTSKGKLILTK